MTTDPTDHLPECYHARVEHVALLCICDRLRSCEARVFVDRTDHWNAALDAAREAVAALPHALNCWDRYGDHVPKADALDAIDALKGVSE